MQATLLILRQDKNESKRQFFDGIEAYESIGYKTINCRCYDKENQLAEVTLVLEDTYEIEYKDSDKTFVNNNIINTSIKGGLLN